MRSLKHILPLKMLDTSNPGTATLPKGLGYSAVAGYIGGDTEHVWTRDQWAQFRHVPKLPIYVDDNKTGRAAGVADGWDCLPRLMAIGVPAGKGFAVAYDIETSKDAQRAYGFASVLNWAGFVVWLYGSRSTVETIPFSDYWIADFTDVSHWPLRSARACQYQPNVTINGITWDISCIRLWQVRTGKLWV